MTRVVVADDQAVVREGLVLLLGLLPGIEVVGSARDGEAALRLVESERPDVVLMDLRMPRMDGVEATRRIRGAHPGTQVVVLTTYSDDESVFAALKAGARGFLTKDAEADDIAEAVDTVMRGDAQLDPTVQRRLLDTMSPPTSSPPATPPSTASPSAPGAPRSGEARPHAASRTAPPPASSTRARLSPSTPAHGASSPTLPPARTGEPLHERHPARRRTRGSGDPLPDGLTPREGEVLTLIADGLSNAEIAARLFIAEATVKTHINNLFAKAGLRDRAQAVTYAYRHGLVTPG